MPTQNQEILDINEHEELMQLDAVFEQQYGSLFEAGPRPGMLIAEQAFPELQQAAELDTVHFLGGVALHGVEVETSGGPEKPNTSSLMAATQLAALGDEQARKVVARNVATDIAERLFKAAHQTTVTMRMVNGHLEQDGRLLTDIHRNTLEHTVLIAEMMRRTKYELTNAMLFERLHRAGLLRDYDAIVFSPSSTEMSAAQKKDYGLFADTESCSIQLLMAEGNDVTLQTAFVAGKRSPDSDRHDLGAIQQLAAERGLEVDTSDGSGVLSHVFLVPKTDVANVADIVRWYDDAAGGTFYGLDLPRQDYLAYAQACEERSSDFGGMVESITEQLLAEAHDFRTPLEAILRLDELSEQYSVEHAVRDGSIDAAVFGETAAMHIEEARFFMQQGQYDRAEESLSMAQQTAESSSCPLFKSSDTTTAKGPDGAGGNNEEGAGEKKWGNCPYCKAKVFIDPCAKKISCWDCTATVINGKVISKGNGGTAKRMAEAESRRQQKAQDARMAQEHDSEFAAEATELFDHETASSHEEAAAAGSLALANA